VVAVTDRPEHLTSEQKAPLKVELAGELQYHATKNEQGSSDAGSRSCAIEHFGVRASAISG
jgi:hypothetical protein